MRFLTNEDVAALVSMRKAIDLMRDLFADVGRGRVDIPERIVIEANECRDAVLFMPGQLRASRRVGLKVVSVFPANPGTFGLPTIDATVLLTDAATGRVAALVEATYLTALRTGAVTGLATDLLARPDAAVLGIFGAGVQARTQVEAVCAVRSIRRILVWSATAAHARAFADGMSSWPGEDVRVAVAESADAVTEESDVIVTATSSSVPVFDGRRLGPGTHVNAIGSFKPTAREVDDATVTRARIFVDHRASAMREAGDLLVPMANGVITNDAVCGDLADLVLGRATGRTRDAEITFFKSVGLSAEDLMVAGHALDKAVQREGAG